jgi:hypothetical protein
VRRLLLEKETGDQHLKTLYEFRSRKFVTVFKGIRLWNEPEAGETSPHFRILPLF